MTIQCLENRTLLAAAFTEFVDPNPSANNGFGTEVVPLSTGNVVVTAPFDDAGGVDAGAVYLFNGATGELISTLTGSRDFDAVGKGPNSIVPLTNGNYLVVSRGWNNGSIVAAGAVTFADGLTGISGIVSDQNSLVGASESDNLGFYPETEIFPLPTGDYVVSNPRASNMGVRGAGSVTHGDGVHGISGVVSAINSLMGTRRQDAFNEIVVLANGDYISIRPYWDSPTVPDAGAITRFDGETGIDGLRQCHEQSGGIANGNIPGSDGH
ncbi:MAG: hypothetical protein R3C49_12260 [Planctomycetaceae bacterium]